MLFGLYLVQLKWAGHVFRVQEYRISRRLLYGELVHGKRHTDRPKKGYKDCIRANLHWSKIKEKKLEDDARDRSRWQAMVKQVSARVKETRCRSIIAHRNRRLKATIAECSTITTYACQRSCKCTLRWSSLHSSSSMDVNLGHCAADM